MYTRLLLLRRSPRQIKDHLCIFYNRLCFVHAPVYCITKRGTIIGSTSVISEKGRSAYVYIIYADQRLISVVRILLCQHRPQSLPPPPSPLYEDSINSTGYQLTFVNNSTTLIMTCTPFAVPNSDAMHWLQLYPLGEG